MPLLEWVEARWVFCNCTLVRQIFSSSAKTLQFGTESDMIVCDHSPRQFCPEAFLEMCKTGPDVLDPMLCGKAMLCAISVGLSQVIWQAVFQSLESGKHPKTSQARFRASQPASLVTSCISLSRPALPAEPPRILRPILAGTSQGMWHGT